MMHVACMLKAAVGRQLRIGYVSADLCQHTVGLFLKDIVQSHDKQQLSVFAYSAGKVKDWVTDAIGGALYGELAGHYKIKLSKQGIRLGYGVEDDALIVMVMAVDKREDGLVYRSALARVGNKTQIPAKNKTED